MTADLIYIPQDGISGVNSKAAPYLEPKGAYSQLPPRTALGEEKTEEDEEEDRKLTEKDLLSFARQIAAGMVLTALCTHTYTTRPCLGPNSTRAASVCTMESTCLMTSILEIYKPCCLSLKASHYIQLEQFAHA